MSKRLKFFLNHLFVSFITALLVVGLIFFIWYPAPLATAVGVTHIFLMVLAIDVIIGPILGLLVYKKGKKTLKLDLSIVITIQIIALCYGIYGIEQGRPAWLAYNVDRFEMVRKNEIIEANISQALPPYQNVSWLKPQFVGVQISDNIDENNKNIFEEILGGISIAQRPERYVELHEVKQQIQQRAQHLEQLKQYNEPSVIKSVLEKYPNANAWLPLKANAVDMVVLINKQKAEVIKIVDLRPWD